MSTAALKQDINPGLQTSLMAFVTDEVTHAVLTRTALERAWANAEILAGGVEEAMGTLTGIETPQLLLVDLSGTGDMVGAVERLAAVCDAGTRFIALGDHNDINLYRRLLDLGVQEYLVKPVSPETLRAAVEKPIEQPEDKTPVPSGLGQIITVIGTCGGAGASSVAVNTAWMLAREKDKRIALVDLDLYFGTAALFLDLESGRGFREALENPERIDALFIERAMVRESENLYVLSGEEALENAFSFDPQALDRLFDYLRRDFDMVVVDLPRFAARSQIASFHEPFTAFLVSPPTLSGMRDSMRLSELIRAQAPHADMKMLLNKAGERKTGELSKADFERNSELSIDRVLPFDLKTVTKSNANGTAWAEAEKKGKAVVPLRGLIDGLCRDEDEAAPPSIWQRVLKKRA